MRRGKAGNGEPGSWGDIVGRPIAWGMLGSSAAFSIYDVFLGSRETIGESIVGL